MMEKTDCHHCIHKRSIPNDSHLACGAPEFRNKRGLRVLKQILTGDADNAVPGITFHEHGIDSNWCFFPINYDPIWLKGECPFFEGL